MHKLIYISVFSVFMNLSSANEVQLNLPKGSLLPGFREYEMLTYDKNPFFSVEIEPESGIELLADTFIESYISAKIQGYLNSEEPTSSALLMKNGGILACGESIGMNLNSEDVNKTVMLTLESIKLPYALFTVEERKFKIDLLATNSRYKLNTEIQLAQGLILHEDGWILAPIGNLKTGDSLSTFIHGIKYSVHLVSLHEEEDLALLKIFKRKPDMILPYAKLSSEAIETGDVLLTQEKADDHPPYKKQVVTDDRCKPCINQTTGAIQLNLKHEVVSMYTNTTIPSSRLNQILGDIPTSQHGPTQNINIATVSIIKE